MQKYNVQNGLRKGKDTDIDLTYIHHLKLSQF